MHLHRASFFLLFGSNVIAVTPRHNRHSAADEVVHHQRRRLEDSSNVNDDEEEGPTFLSDLASRSIKFVGCRNLFPEEESPFEVEGFDSEEFEEAWLSLVEELVTEEVEVLEEGDEPMSPTDEGPPMSLEELQELIEGDSVPPVAPANPFSRQRQRRRGDRRKLEQEEPELSSVVSFKFCPEDRSVPPPDFFGDFPDLACSAPCNEEVMTVDMRTYLEVVLSYKSEMQEVKCDRCNKCYEAMEAAQEDAEGEDAMPSVCIGVDIPICYDECQMIENMEENGYMDAFEFAECQQVGTTEEGEIYFLGPMCTSSGSRISIGVFTNEECTAHDPSKEVEDFLRNEDGHVMKLSYHLMKHAFVGDGACVAGCSVSVDEDELENGNESGAESQNAINQNANDVDYFMPEVNEACRDLYDAYHGQEYYYTPAYGNGGHNYDNHDDHDDDVYISIHPIGYNDGEICVSQTLGGAYYAGIHCEFPATSMCSAVDIDDDEDGVLGNGVNVSSANVEMPHFCTNNGTCMTLSMVDDSLDDTLFPAGDDWGVSDDGFYCACPPLYYGRYCELVVHPPVEAMTDDYEDEDELDWGNRPPYYYNDDAADHYDDSVNYTVREREALTDFYKAARGEKWDNKEKWLSSGVNVCEWYGIACDEAGSVTHLDLSGNSIEGYFDGRSLAQLGNLTVLDLSDNALFGTISPNVGARNLRLSHLNLSNNNLRGAVPHDISFLSNLEILDLHGNQFQFFPFDSFTYANLASVTRVDISSNMLTGTLPFRFSSGNPNLRYLKMSHNKLAGSIPSAMMNTAFEAVFALEDDEIDEYEYVLDLSFNRFEGNVPNFGAVNLNLDVAGNRLTYIDLAVCEHDWNNGATLAFGCDGIACPIGTVSSEGRQTTEENQCLNCPAALFIGTVECREDAVTEEYGNSGGNTIEDPFDLAKYDIKFVGCRNLLQQRDSEIKSLATFRFCPHDEDTGCHGTCDSSEHEEMTLDMQAYLSLVLDHKIEEQAVRCNQCQMCQEIEPILDSFIEAVIEQEELEEAVLAMCSDVDTSTCVECENMVIMDDWEFIECTLIHADEREVYYAKAMCDGGSSQLKLGVFTDADCSVRDPSKEVEQFMQGNDKLPYHLLTQAIAPDGECPASCRYDSYYSPAEMGQFGNEMNELMPFGKFCTELFETYWREGYSEPNIEADAAQDLSAIFIPGSGGGSGKGEGGGVVVGGRDPAPADNGGGPLNTTYLNLTSSDAATNIPSKAPSLHPSSDPPAQTLTPTGGPTEFMDVMASDTNTGCNVFPRWQLIPMLLIPLFYCVKPMHV